MTTTFRIILKSATRDAYLLFWSILLPLGLLIGLGLYLNTEEYHIQLLAGVIGTSTVFWAMVTTAFSILQQRNRGVYKLLKITPMKTSSFIISLTAAWTVVSLVVTTIILMVGILFFDIKISIGAIPVFYAIIIVATLCFTFLSFLVANVSKNEGQASAVSNVLVLPMLFLSNAFYSLNSAPDWIRFLTRLNPFSYFVNGLRNAIQNSLWSSAIQMIILLGFAIIALFIAVFTFRWDPE